MCGGDLVSAEDILSQPQPPPDERVSYGADPNQFLDVRLPRAKGPHSILLNIHGGYWRAKNDLKHAGHLCEALRKAGVATFNLEYRRVGNPGGDGPERSRISGPPTAWFSRSIPGSIWTWTGWW